jgi:hypothetical protein
VHFLHTIPIVIPGPRALARREARTGMGASTFGQMVVRLSFIRVHGRRVRGAFLDEGLERLPIAMVANIQTNLATLAPGHFRAGMQSEFTLTP